MNPRAGIFFNVFKSIFLHRAFIRPSRTRRSCKDSHRDEGVEATESGAHGLDADGRGEHDFVQEDGAERDPDVAYVVLFER